MNLPGFSAEASLQRIGLAYNMAWVFDEMGNVVRPQVCDQTCLDDCESNCLDPGDCSDLPPQSRGQCLAQVAACRRACIKRCCPPPPPTCTCTTTRHCSDGSSTTTQPISC